MGFFAPIAPQLSTASVLILGSIRLLLLQPVDMPKMAVQSCDVTVVSNAPGTPLSQP